MLREKATQYTCNFPEEILWRFFWLFTLMYRKMELTELLPSYCLFLVVQTYQLGNFYVSRRGSEVISINPDPR